MHVGIAGVPNNTHVDNVEDECLKVVGAGNVMFGIRNLAIMDILAEHWKKTLKKL